MIIMISFLKVNLDSSTRGKSIQSSIEKGQYIPSDLVTVQNLIRLPIPYSNEDYAFYQSIGKISNIVIGNFKHGERKITLITDKNADGKVDLVADWFIDLERIDIHGNPDKYCSAEKFVKMKENILIGKSESLSPNPEGLSYLKTLLKTTGNITRVRHGFKVFGDDTDQKSKRRVSYYYSNNGVHGVDLAFEVKYYNLGTKRVSPPINFAVYCKNSFDPFTIEMVKKLLKETNFPPGY